MDFRRKRQKPNQDGEKVQRETLSQLQSSNREVRVFRFGKIPFVKFAKVTQPD